MEFSFFQNNPKNQDLSYKMGLDFLDSLRRVKLIVYQITKDWLSYL